MKLFVGLGNYGKEYEGTRHNMGFKTIDKFATLAGGDFDRDDFKGLFGVIKNPAFSEPIIICKPQTYMNLSGTCVRPLADYFKIPLEDIVVVYDDMALPEGSIRLRENGTSGGHKGIQNIIEQYGSDKVKRIRIGIGEPPHNNPIDYVLGKPTGESLAKIEDATERAAKALRDIELKSFAYAMSIYNAEPKEKV
jgi:peptidyl-tRNA hydrolase, PTH1 family